MDKKTFSITAAKSAVKLDAKRTGEASFTVTNTSDKQATGQLKLRPMEAPSVIAAQSSWFAPLGDAKFPPQATTQVTAKFISWGGKEINLLTYAVLTAKPGK